MQFATGRKPKKYKFTVTDIGFIVGKQPRTVQEHIKQGKLNPNDLLSIHLYILKYRKKDHD